MPENLYSTDI